MLKQRPAASFSESGSKHAGKKRVRVDTAASILAILDERGYHRSLLQDANNINHRIVTPMILPWMHAGLPVARNIPCDIDEMPEILAVDDGTHTPFENGPFGFGNFAMGQMQSGEQNLLDRNSVTMRTAARRSLDPGVVELSTITLGPDEFICGSHDDSPTDLWCSKDDSLGELSLRCFELAQQRLKRRIKEAKSLTRKQLISVKVSSTSSKVSIFPVTPLKLVDAKLPAEVQDARFLSIARAKKISEKLGTYDCRHGLAPTNASGKNANRVSVGRTRRMWTAKSPADKPQRVFFTSLLTGEKLDSGTQKRPRDIRLAIKVNEEYLESGATVNSLTTSQEWPENGVNTVSTEQCTVDTNKLVSALAKGQFGKSESPLSIGQVNTLIKPATFDCIPDNTGLISVTCTLPGSIAISSVHGLLNEAANQESALCTICWSKGCRELGALQKCSECYVLVHPQCCLDSGIVCDSQRGIEGATASTWLCSVCHNSRGQTAGTVPQLTAKSRRRISRPPNWLKDSLVESPVSKSNTSFQSPLEHSGHKCFLCPFSGGAMSMVEVKGVCLWVHEVCRIWTDLESTKEEPVSTEAHREEECALCGIGDTKTISHVDRIPSIRKSLVKCAAARCRVFFHPMCALLVSKLTWQSSRPRKSPQAGLQSSPRSPQILKDLDLASRFTLTVVDCEAVQKGPGKDRLLQIPVCFCCFHNPMREPSLYGIYPGGEHIDERVLRVPPHRDAATTSKSMPMTSADPVGEPQ